MKKELEKILTTVKYAVVRQEWRRNEKRIRSSGGNYCKK